MARQSNKVTAGEVVASTQKYSNVDDDSRLYDIVVDVNIQNGKPVNFNNGTVTAREGGNGYLASFNSGENYQYFGFSAGNSDAEEIKALVGLVLEFIDNVEKEFKE